MGHEKERILHVWDAEMTDPESALGLLVCTQERVGFVRRPRVLRPAETIANLALEGLTNIERHEDRRGSGQLLLNDGRRQYVFRVGTADPELVAGLLSHLKWAREGFASGYLDEHGFEQSLVDAIRDDMVSGRYEVAVRNAFTLLESRIRDDLLVGPGVNGVDLIKEAFHPETGRLVFGRTQGEREGLHSLYRGAFLMFRNPAAHTYGYLEYGKDEAFALLSFSTRPSPTAHTSGWNPKN